MKNKRRLLLSLPRLLLSLPIAISIAASNSPSVEGENKTSTQRTVRQQELDFSQIERITGLKGVRSHREYKISVPQNDLSVSVDGFRVVPPMGLTSWVAFAPSPHGAIAMGDLVVLEDEIKQVEKVLISSGLTVTGLHNHFVRDRPKAMFMHIHGVGPTHRLARAVRRALDKVKELREAKGFKAQSFNLKSSLAPPQINAILGHSGNMKAGIYKVTIGRPDVRLIDHGVQVSTFMGFNTWMAFQGSSERAAVSGDFTMLEHEVAPVIEALVKHNIEVVAVHNHMTHEEPRIFFLHFWGVGAVEELAKGLKSGLEQVDTSTANDQ